MFDRLVREGLEAGGVGKDEGVHRIAEVGEERVEAGGRVMSRKNNYNGKVPFSKLTAAAVEREMFSNKSPLAEALDLMDLKGRSIPGESHALWNCDWDRLRDLIFLAHNSAKK